MALKLRTPLPSLASATKWLNSPPLGPEQLAGVPVLIHFWAIGCHLCKEQLPTVLRWRQKFEPRGLRVVGAHTRVKGTPPGTDKNAIAAAAREYGLIHPIAIDATDALAREFQIVDTPAYFVFDSNGLLRHYHSGYSADSLVEHALERVFREFEGARPGAT